MYFSDRWMIIVDRCRSAGPRDDPPARLPGGRQNGQQRGMRISEVAATKSASGNPQRK